MTTLKRLCHAYDDGNDSAEKGRNGAYSNVPKPLSPVGRSSCYVLLLNLVVSNKECSNSKHAPQQKQTHRCDRILQKHAEHALAGQCLHESQHGNQCSTIQNERCFNRLSHHAAQMFEHPSLFVLSLLFGSELSLLVVFPCHIVPSSMRGSSMDQGPLKHDATLRKMRTGQQCIEVASL